MLTHGKLFQAHPEAPVSLADQPDVTDMVSHQPPDQVVSEVGEEQFVIELTEDVTQLSPPLIVQPLQPVAVHEGRDNTNLSPF